VLTKLSPYAGTTSRLCRSRRSRPLAGELTALGRATPGQRNRTLNRTAFKVYRYVAGGVLDDQDVTVAFTTTALAIGLDRAEIGRALASARTAGLANPRTIPPPPDQSRGEVRA
jgi:hypothetical protein